MAASDPTSARTEAERLVATALAAVRLGTSGRVGGFGPLGDLITGVLGHSGGAPSAAPRPSASHPAPSDPSSPPPGSTAQRSHSAGSGAGSTGGTPGGAFATDSPECCVCPICRAITALRDPSPEFAERLATGAGDFAAGVASLLRALASAPGPASRPDPTAGPTGATAPTSTPPAPASTTTAPTGATTGATRAGAGEPAAPSVRLSPDDEVWRGATRTGHDSWPAPERDVWAAATHAATETRTDRAAPPADAAGPTGATARPAPTSSSGAGPAAEPAGPSPVVPAARVPGEPVLAEGDAGDGA